MARLTKKAVREELQGIRDKVGYYAVLSPIEMEEEHLKVFPTIGKRDMTWSERFRQLVFAATYHAQSVLDLD